MSTDYESNEKPKKAINLSFNSKNDLITRCLQQLSHLDENMRIEICSQMGGKKMTYDDYEKADERARARKRTQEEQEEDAELQKYFHKHQDKFGDEDTERKEGIQGFREGLEAPKKERRPKKPSTDAELDSMLSKLESKMKFDDASDQTRDFDTSTYRFDNPEDKNSFDTFGSTTNYSRFDNSKEFGEKTDEEVMVSAAEDLEKKDCCSEAHLMGKMKKIYRYISQMGK